MIRLNRWWYAFVVIVALGAIFVDGYSYVYRITTHQSLSGPLNNAPPTLLGHPVFIHKGLDLQGGTELTIAICEGFNDPPGSNCRNGVPGGNSDANLTAAQTGTINVLRQRINGLGVSEPVIEPQGNDEVLVQLPGISIDQAISVVGKTSKLHFAIPVAGAPGPLPPGATADTCPDNIKADQQNLCDATQFNDGVSYIPGYHWKILDPAISASDVTSADVTLDQSSQWAVTITFDSKGSDEWSKITQAAYSAGAGPPVPPLNHVAIFLDNEVITAPTVSTPSSSSTEITGNFTQDSATQLSQDISAGALPAEISTIESNEVSATLGADTVRKSLIAGVVGLIVVILFMLGYYRFPGVLASIALILYASIVLAIFKLTGVVLSLAGMAGFVLSVGMAVDANVLIFERTRDELRHGRGVGLAVETGFRRAFPAIRDSNVSTMITCIVLYSLGTDVIRGFALTLFIGVAVSFFSAIIITQSLFNVVLRWKLGRRPDLYTTIQDPETTKPLTGRFDIVKRRNAFFLLSLAIIIPGIVSILFVKPSFNLGLDFAGGNEVQAVFSTNPSLTDVENAVNKAAPGLSPVVQSQGADSFLIRTLPSSIDKVQAITTALDSQFHFARDKTGKDNVQVQTVGPTVASDLVRTAVELVFVSSVLIAAYLFLMFRGQKILSASRFGVCTFFKLLHDVFVLIGIWAILGHFTDLGQVDSLFVTAVLTSVAFSIHDTIVVFDRVRENLRSGPRLTFDQIVNLSTVQTMTRSLNTALTVTFVLVSLVIFGGDSIRGFVLALLIGIITGTYSSIFNASTLLVAWQKVDKGREVPPPARGVRRVQPGRA